jgi:hypothetical protein
MSDPHRPGRRGGEDEGNDRVAHGAADPARTVGDLAVPGGFARRDAGVAKLNGIDESTPASL